MKRAFTIVELLVVLGIISLLTAVVINVSFDALIHARALQVAVNLTAIMKAAQSRLLTNDATTSNIGELDVDFESLTEYSLDMDYRENDATVEVKIYYSGIVSKNHIAGILDPDASIQAEGNKIAYSKVFPVYW